MGGGTPCAYLDAIRRDYPISLHGVGLSLGSAEGLDAAHLERIRQVAERVEPALMSEHIAWSIVEGTYLADLLPLPMTEEALAVVCRHVDQVQSCAAPPHPGRKPVDLSCAFAHSTIPEWEFMAAVAERTGCGILCDVNNIYVSAHNHGWDASPISPRCRRTRSAKSISPATACARLPAAARCGSTITVRAVIADVWALYRRGAGALRAGPDA